MAQVRAPKQWRLTKEESITSFEAWRQNLQYTLSLDPNFAPFLVEGFTWQKKRVDNPERGLTDDGDNVPEANRRTSAQKVTHLELMLGQIANFCPIISRNTIVKSSTSINCIWQAIRLHYGFQSTGSHFLDFDAIQLEPGERPEDLYQRLTSFIEDNLLRTGGSISHMGELPTQDEEISPTVENLVVLTWLRLIDKRLPTLVKQRYATDLRSRTLASLKPEISLALDSLLDEIHSASEAKVLRSAFKSNYQNNKKPTQSSRPPPSCPLCKQAGRPRSNHFMSKCRYLPEHDRLYMESKVRQSTDYESPVEFDEEDEEPPAIGLRVATSRRVSTKQSPTLRTFYKHHPLNVTLDTGAEINMIKLSVAQTLGVPIKKSSQRALQADGSTPLKIAGETCVTLTRGNHNLTLEALVVNDLDVDLIGGIPFMCANDIMVRPARQQIVIGGEDFIFYTPSKQQSSENHVRRTQAFVLRASGESSVTWPGSYLEIDLPSDVQPDETITVEPKFGSSLEYQWPAPQVVEAVCGKIRLLNATENPIHIRKHDHVCQARYTTQSYMKSSEKDYHTVTRNNIKKSTALHSDAVCLDPDNVLTDESYRDFKRVLSQFDDVFDTKFPGYNGASGPIKAVVNMGPVQPPQRKGRLPQYGRDKLVELQERFDELEAEGVFAKPEDVDITVEYLNPSFLVKKPQGGHRLVTAFADVGRYAKPQPSLMPDVDSVLRTIGHWRYIIVTDLTSAFYQIPLTKDSMKYCGVCTPFRGIRTYTRCAMGMPGSETALEELMSRVLGDLLQEGVVAKLADDLYCGGNTIQELLQNWTRVLSALQKNDLKLKPSKTTICPKTTTILGWIWSEGTLSASPHRTATLAACQIPTTVHGLRSFIGAFKVLGRVLPMCSQLMAPLDDIVAGKNSSDKIVWSDSNIKFFHTAQTALSSRKSITLPRRSDLLWIVTDGSVKNRGIGATLYVSRNGSLQLSGFFSAKLRKHQVTWLPCEIEALSIAAAVKHFSPFIIQSDQQACVLTDSKPCVQAIDKLCRGEFSASPRVTSFLTTVSRYQVAIKHLAGSANIPSDFASRNAPECDQPNCQICSFVALTEDSVVRSIKIDDILSSTSRLPFTNRNGWRNVQSECPDLRRVHSHLSQGTRPSKKVTNAKDVKRYLNVATIAKDGLLVVKRTDPLSPPQDLIVIPRSAIDGLLTALHIKLDHPSAHQLQQVVKRHFFALDLSQAIDRVTDSCHTCASLRRFPQIVTSQSTEDPPEVVGMSFAADVIKRNKQCIMVLRETTTSYTAACFIDNEKSDTVREAIVCLIAELHPIHGPPAVVRVDPAPCFMALREDKTLQQFNIILDVGRVKNVNKNPVAEKCILELEDEILRLEPGGGQICKIQLAVAVSRLNCRIRREGLSARELWTQRNQFTHEQLPITDMDVILNQHESRKSNHKFSEKCKNSKSRNGLENIGVGDIVYLYADKNKLHARQRYLVVSIQDDWCYIKKFTGNQLRASSYKVKKTECFRVPADIAECKIPVHLDDSDCDEPITIPPAPETVSIPSILTTPANQDSRDADPIPLIGVPFRSHGDDVNMDINDNVNDVPNVSDHHESDADEPAVPPRPRRQRRPPKYLEDYVT